MELEKINLALQKLDNWQHINGVIQKSFRFDDYQTTMFFVNAIAWISHNQNHHPEIEIGYNFCTVKYTTHEISGISENDFTCAAKVDHLATI